MREKQAAEDEIETATWEAGKTPTTPGPVRQESEDKTETKEWDEKKGQK